MKRRNAGVDEAIQVAGDQYKLADLLGVTQPAIQHFLFKKISAERAKQIERVTGVPREKIRPDIFDRARR